MDDIDLRVLEQLYVALCVNIETKYKRIIGGSVILHFLNTKSNDRYRLILDSSIQHSKLNAAAVSNLLSKGLVKNDSEDRVCITGNGVWLIEQNHKKISPKKLSEYINHKYFLFESSENSTLNEKSKVVLFSMMATRAFSEKSSIKLKESERKNDYWKKIIDQCFDFMKEQELITNMKHSELYRKGAMGTEHPVSQLIRHTDQLPKTTNRLFKTKGKEQCYYLDLSGEHKDTKKSLMFLLKKILGDKPLEPSRKEKVIDFMMDIAYNDSVFIFDMKEHNFLNHEYDDLLRSSILEF